MNKLLKFAFAMVAALSLTSCSSYFYQVYGVETDNLKQQDGSLVYENEDCKVLYNLWSNKGYVSFAFYNKTDHDIFVNLGQTFLAVNGQALDYYKERTYTESDYSHYTTAAATGVAKENGFALWGSNTYMESANAVASVVGAKSVKAFSKSVSVKEQEIICIPSKCYKFISKCAVNPSRVVTCEGKIDNPYDSYEVARYSKSNSPITFKNRIAYGFNKNNVADKHIDNTFWITSIKNYSRNAATEKKATEDCIRRSGFGATTKYRQFKIGGPDKFYIVYATY